MHSTPQVGDTWQQLSKFRTGLDTVWLLSDAHSISDLSGNEVTAVLEGR